MDDYRHTEVGEVADPLQGYAWVNKEAQIHWIKNVVAVWPIGLGVSQIGYRSLRFALSIRQYWARHTSDISNAVG